MSRTVNSFARIAARHTTKASTSAQPLLTRGYHDSIVEHYENPRNVGSLDKNDTNVGTVSLSDLLEYHAGR